MPYESTNTSGAGEMFICGFSAAQCRHPWVVPTASINFCGAAWGSQLGCATAHKASGDNRFAPCPTWACDPNRISTSDTEDLKSSAQIVDSSRIFQSGCFS